MPRRTFAPRRRGAMAELDSDTWVSEGKRIRGKKLPVTAARVQKLREEHTWSIEPARALAAETVNLERTLSKHPAQVRTSRFGLSSFHR